jgi:hypothetical protein
MRSNQDPPNPDDTSPNGHDLAPSAVDSEREALDARVTSGEEVESEALIAALKSDNPPQGDLFRHYAERLLAHALQVREDETANFVTQLMDADESLDAALWRVLNDTLQIEPDAVYAFIRARTAADPDDKWLFRLRVAALCALEVAITDGDNETAFNWLKLVAREPASYNLIDLLHYAILAAGERAHNDGEFGRMLMPFAVRRDPAAAEILLADEALLEAMETTNLGRTLRDFEGDALSVLENRGPEMFLVMLARAAQAQKGALFTPTAVEQMWALANGATPVNVPSQYAADRIIEAWAANGAAWLDEAALQSVLSLALRDRRDELFRSVIGQLTESENFVKLLVTAMQRSARPEADLLALTTQMMNNGDLTAQSATDTYVRLLTAWEWRRSAQPIVQQLVRIVQQHPNLTIALDALWQILSFAAESKDDGILRIVVRRLTAEIETVEDEGILADHLLRLVNETAWHIPTRQNLVVWWRGFVRSGTLARLQRLDKALDGKKMLDELRTIVQTVIAFRKMLGKRTLREFAWDVGVAYGILQALTESFDPSPKRQFSFDQTTMRAELEARADEMTPHEQKIMANNFKELAQIIAGMGDNRAKASLMRRGDDVDRLLMTGDQQPHSAVDAMKWLAGFLGGSQEKDDEEIE